MFEFVKVTSKVLSVIYFTVERGVVSFSSTIERRLSLLVTSASDLQLRTIKLCSFLFGVFVHVINKIHWCVAVYAVHTNALPTVNCWPHSSSHRSDSQMFVENRDFFVYSTSPFWHCVVRTFIINEFIRQVKRQRTQHTIKTQKKTLILPK